MTTLYQDSFRNVLPAGQEGNTDNIGYIRVAGSTIRGFPIVISGWQINLQEKTHVLESFNEHVHAYAFGKGVGTAMISGHSLENSDNNVKHVAVKDILLKEYTDKLRALSAAKSGNLVRITGPGDGLVFSGVVTQLSLSMSADPSNVLNFQMQMLILDSALGV